MIISRLIKICSCVMSVLFMSFLSTGCSGNNDNSLSTSDNLQQRSGFTYYWTGGWKLCVKCNSVYYGPAETTSRCAAGGTHEHENNSYSYKMLYNCDSPAEHMQVGWKYCTKCNVIFWCTVGGTVIRQCPAGSENNGYVHTSDQNSYFLLTQSVNDFGSIQGGWRYCGQCTNLFYSGGNQSLSCTCAPQHDGTVSYNYYLPYNLPGVNYN